MIRLLLVLIVFTVAIAESAGFDNGGYPTKLSASEWPKSADDALSAVGSKLQPAAEQLSYRRQLSQASAKAKPLKQRETIKYTYTSKGDFFSLSADQWDPNGYAYFYVWGSNSVSSSSDPSGSQIVPSKFIYLSFTSCKTSTNPSGDVVWSDCIDVWGSSDNALQLSLDKTYSGAVSASFAGSKTDPKSDTFLPVTISLALTLPCNKANITKFDSACKSSSRTGFGSSPVSRYRSEYKAGTTSCAIERSSVSGSIWVDVPGSSGIDILAFFKTAVTDYTSASTGTTKDSSISISKGFMF